MQQLKTDDFLLHFWNSPRPPGPSCTVLCGLVERLQLGAVMASDMRVFVGQRDWQVGPEDHVELDFLHWLWSLQTPEDADFLVTCFASGSPCPSCAEQVGAFLGAHRKVRLRLLTARLRCPWDPAHCEGLWRLHRHGVLVDVMSLQDFRWCWELFVSTGGPLEAWWGLSRNHGLLLGTLQDILGTRMAIDTFIGNFDARPVTATILCYEVEGAEGRIPEAQRTGFLRNRGRDVNWRFPAHAELLLLGRVINDWNLDPELPCGITCYISWSPCAECAQKLVRFLRQYPRVQLSIRAARIYSLGDYERGLRALRDAGARVSIMTRADFEHCWDTFVQSEGQPFNPPSYLDAVSQQSARSLESILEPAGSSPEMQVPE